MDQEPDPAERDSEEHARLLDRLRRIAGRLDPVPDRLVEAARVSFAVRRLDAELADLIADEQTPALVRGPAEPSRLLRFAAGDLVVEVEVAHAGSARQLIGQLIPPGPAVVEVRHPGGIASTEADEYGRFATPEFPAGPVSLRIHRPDGPEPRLVETAWQPV